MVTNYNDKSNQRELFSFIVHNVCSRSNNILLHRSAKDAPFYTKND
jgi:hypothetical protein